MRGRDLVSDGVIIISRRYSSSSVGYRSAYHGKSTVFSLPNADKNATFSSASKWIHWNHRYVVRIQPLLFPSRLLCCHSFGNGLFRLWGNTHRDIDAVVRITLQSKAVQQQQIGVALRAVADVDLLHSPIPSVRV